jgi:hypothetical protein
VQDALSIQREHTGIRGQIEQVQGRMQYLNQSSDMSPISLSIRPIASPPKPPPAWDPALIVAKAWSSSLAVLQALAVAILSTLVFGWWIIPARPRCLVAAAQAQASNLRAPNSRTRRERILRPCPAEGHFDLRTAVATIHCMW